MKMTIFIKNKRVAILNTPEFIPGTKEEDKIFNAMLINICFDEVSKALGTKDWHFDPQCKEEDIFGTPEKYFDYSKLSDQFEKCIGGYRRVNI